MKSATPIHIVSLGCARNEVDSEELAARLEAGGFRLVAEPSEAEAVVVNTCGFIASAKKDSIDTLLAAADLKGAVPTRRVVALGCLAERYGRELAQELPEVDAVLGFDDYGDIDAKLRRVLAGDRLESHVPTDRRRLLPVSPVQRPAALPTVAVPGLSAGRAPASGPRAYRRRLEGGPSAAVKIASGCDRRCAFCAIPSFRGSFVSRPVAEVVDEVRWLVTQGVREAFLVSENTSSYGKDLGDRAALPRLLGELSRIDGLEWIRVSYLQPAEVRPDLVDALCSTGKVVPYFDLSFQHAAPGVLRRMRRFGDPDSFLALLEGIRTVSPRAGVRSNVIVGFPGETDNDVETLVDFLGAARLDALGVFAYSDEEGTEAQTLPDHLDEETIAERYERVSDLASALVDDRAAERVGERVRVLVESLEGADAVGRAEHQGPEVDGTCLLPGAARAVAVGDLVWGRVASGEGADLIVHKEGADEYAEGH